MSAKLHRLWHAQEGRCYYCGCGTYLPGSGESKSRARLRFGIVEGVRGGGKAFRRRHATIEHLKRRADGGTLANVNIVMACKGCNVRRGDMTVEAYKAHVAAELAAGQHHSVCARSYGCEAAG